MSKLNLTEAYPEYYKAKSNPQLVELEPYQYITIQGNSEPNAPVFLAAIDDLYKLVYGIKFFHKNEGMDFVVPKMEAFWWVDGELPFEETPQEEWYWKIMFRMPDFVGEGEFKLVVDQLVKEGKLANDHQLEFESIHEGKSVQALHIGSYYDERGTLEKIFAFMKDNDLEMNGQHHEIYISDPRKTVEEKLKTILRYAVK
ncbi:GyrI-like domain-containing protein [Roseivirga echinicomitans]|nr:GyrI-like domain-containing protein [Roseivirga echinicomitans]